MCPDVFVSYRNKQRGSALVIAIFIIVVMTILVAALSKMLIGSSESVSYEVLGTRAFFAAQSGMEQGLSQLFPLSATSSYCAPIGVTGSEAEVTVNFTANGLQGCSYTLSCDSGRATAAVTETVYYQLTSTGSCGTGQLQTSRTIQMEVWQ
ncbi:pilus assembly PilX N-terminal domain-containing protein [Rheinheimera sp.]|uniref:pilus assembly PilX N-terminal domain-containing protein n=1 Tax=Rheinheimera sp. TaxID=1869214 RepID=UPI002626F250|nr:pilus assembly PilX N-terminal domain-containing protein [Rheinheimera sp.]MCA1929294.1 pilus assembly PilX N-terminal domain-containing protein [Rheinheimera sp.]